MFSITQSKGFRVTLENGVTISVQWGPHSYGSYYGDDRPAGECGQLGADLVEIGIFVDGKMLEDSAIPEDMHGAYADASEFVKFVNWANSLPKKTPSE